MPILKLPVNEELGIICPNRFDFLDKANALGYDAFQHDTRPLNFNIIGWRNLKGRVNKYDDFISLYWVEHDKWNEMGWPATTVPGVPFLKNPINLKGTAILVPGQYRGCYDYEFYKGNPALIQSKAVKVYRDKNYDGVIDKDPKTIEEGLFGLHIHRGGIWSSTVNKNSAGCQVFKIGADFDEFITLIKQSTGFWGYNFTYTLLEF